MLLEVEGLEVRYGRTVAVKGLSFGVAPDEIVTVLGGDGGRQVVAAAGAAGPRPSAAGQVRFDGVDVTRMTPPQRLRHGLALVPEGRQIAITLTVHENLLMGAYCRDDAAVAGDIDGTSTTASPIWRGGAACRPRCCRAASSRCWRSAAPCWRGRG